jgi:hypothetical protein
MLQDLKFEKSYSPDVEECLTIRHDDPGIRVFKIFKIYSSKCL